MVSELRSIMDATAQGDAIPSGGYERLRRALLSDAEVAPRMPRWLRATRTSDEFAEMLRTDAGGRDQLEFIRRELEPALAYLEDLAFNLDHHQNVQEPARQLSVDRSGEAEQPALPSRPDSLPPNQPAERDQDHLLLVIFERFHGSGEWPSVDRLRYELDQADDELDVIRVGRDLDPVFGSVGIGQDARASLTIHGIARCAGSAEELDDVLRTIMLAYKCFRTHGPGARIDSGDVEVALGLGPLQLRRTFELIQWQPGIGGGTGGASDSWSREITPDITRFRRLRTTADLLALAHRPGRSTGLAAPTQPVLASTPVATAIAVAPGSAALASLHPSVAETAGALFDDAHYAQAAFQAFKALEVRLRTLSGLDLSGRDLAASALAGDSPCIVVSRHDGRTGADEQGGMRFILMGVMQGLRNPGGHGLDALDRQEAFEQLAVVSLLMRWLDTARKGDQAAAELIRPKPQSRALGQRGHERPRSRQVETSPRLVVLGELQEISHRQARTSTILDLELQPLADRSGVPFEKLQDALVDVLAEGLAEPYAATMDRSPEQGACRITGEGVRELARLR